MARIQDNLGNSISGSTVGLDRALNVNVLQQSAIIGTQTSTLVDAVDAAITATLNGSKLGLDVNIVNQSAGSGDKEVIGVTSSNSVTPIGGIDDAGLIAKIKARSNGRLTVEQLSYVFNIIKGAIVGHHWHDNAVKIMFATQDVPVLLTEGIWLPPLTQGQWSIVSTSTLDSNVTGTGAQKIDLEFYNTAGVKSSETVLLAGLTPVNIVALDAFRLQEAIVSLAGSLQLNQGTISILDGPNGSGAVIAEVLPLNNSVKKLVFYTGANETMFAVQSSVVTSNKNIICYVELHEGKGTDMAGSFIEHKKRYFASGKGSGEISPDFPILVPPFSFIEIYGEATNAGDTGWVSLGGWVEV